MAHVPLAATIYVHELNIPSNPGLIEALGKLVIAHTQLELALRYTVKTLSGLSVSDALDATRYDRLDDLRDRIKQLFKDNKATAQDKTKLDALLNKGKRLSSKRHSYMHSAWSATPSGIALIKSEDDHSWGPAPEKEQVEDLALKIFLLARALNKERLHGFIAQVVTRHNAAPSVTTPPSRSNHNSP